MNRQDLENCDKLLKKLYWHNNRSSMYPVNMRSLFNEVGIEYKEGIPFINYLEAKELIVKTKRLSGNNYIIKITGKGIKFHAEDNLIDEHDRRHSPAQAAYGVQNTYNAPVNHIAQGDNGKIKFNQDTFNNPEPKTENWFFKHLKEIIVGLIIAGLAAYFGLK